MEAGPTAIDLEEPVSQQPISTRDSLRESAKPLYASWRTRLRLRFVVIFTGADLNILLISSLAAVVIFIGGCENDGGVQPSLTPYRTDFSDAQLQRAALEGDLRLVKLCLDAGVNIDGSHTVNGAAKPMTPLACAALRRHPLIVKLLLGAGADPNASADDLGRTPLILACSNTDIDSVRLLLGAGGSVNAADEEGVTALMTASASNCVECIDILVKAGADVHHKASQKWDNGTALAFAVEKGNFEVIEALADAGAILLNEGSLLHLAVALHQVDRVQGYLARGVDVDARDKNGLTALHYDQRFNRTAFEAMNINGRMEIVGVEATITKMLLEAGADVNAQDALGQTALHYAGITFDQNNIRSLIAAGADPSIKSAAGFTAAEIFKRAWDSNPIPTRSSGRDRLAYNLVYHKQLALFEGRDADAVTQAILESDGRILLPPQFTIKALLSSDDGAKALISQQKIGLRRSEYQLVQKGDLISLSGVEWTILDIDPENKSVEVESVTSGVTHVITYDP